MAHLPLVQTDLLGMRDWQTPADIQEAFRIQPQFVLPDCASLRWTVLSTVIPGTLFLRWVLPQAARPEKAILDSWSCSTCSLWAFGALLGFAAAACQNPGVVPRTPQMDEEAQTHKTPPKYVSINGVLVRRRWCSTCRVHRPLRSKHCSYCDRCVFRFDHHCTWLGNCVGLGNYRSFLVLVLTASLFFGHSMILTLQVLRRDMRGSAAGSTTFFGGVEDTLRRLFVANAGMTLYFAYALVMFLAFLVLLLYHGIIIACNLTTNEHVRDYYLAKNPYNVACGDNYRQVLCAPYGRPVSIEPDPATSRQQDSAHLEVPQRATAENGHTPLSQLGHP